MRGRYERLRAAVLVIVATILTPAYAYACPDCQLGRQVRARIAAEAPWTNVAMLALPLIVIAIIAAMLHRIGRPSSDDATRRT